MNPAKPVRQLRPADRADRPLLDQRQPPPDLLDDAKTGSDRAGIDPENSHGWDCNCPREVQRVTVSRGDAETRRRFGELASETLDQR